MDLLCVVLSAILPNGRRKLEPIESVGPGFLHFMCRAYFTCMGIHAHVRLDTQAIELGVLEQEKGRTG